MGLKRFDYKLPGQRKNFKQIAIVLCICLIAVLSFTSYALYEVRHPNNFVDSKVGEFNTSDVSLAILVDGVKADAFPAKDSGKVFEKLECTNGGSASWNSETWKLTINDITGPTECTISFIEKQETAAEKLTELAKTNTVEMFTDDTADANIRYMGVNPNNYIDTGNGKDADGNPILWRIIGVMNNVDDGTGNKETRIKIIRETSIGNLAWDARCDDPNLQCGSREIQYKNNWDISSLNKSLNSAFYHKTIATDPNYVSSYNWNYLDYTNNGITEEMSKLMRDATFYLGGPDYNQYSTWTTSEYYVGERNTNAYGDNPKTWVGKVGLMYPSDYGYATSGGATTSKEMCMQEGLYNWYKWNDKTRYADCKNNDWLFYQDHTQWTMTPSSTSMTEAMTIDSNGYISSLAVVNLSYVHPVVYLRSDVKIMGGTGTKTDPYVLGL